MVETKGERPVNETLESRPLKPAEYEVWDRLVEASPAGTVYHYSQWLRSVSEAVGDRLVLIGFFQAGELVAGFPCQVRGRGPLKLARRAFATPYSNLLVRPDVEANAEPLVNEALRKLSRGFSCIVVTQSPFANELPLCARWQTREKATYVVDIRNTGRLWQSFSHQLRKDVRKAEKLGITVSSPCPPETLSRLYRSACQRRGLTPPLSGERLVLLLGKVLGAGLGRTYLAATAEREPCVARLVLYDSRRAYCALVGLDREVRQTGASELLVWSVIRDFSKTHGELDLVGANSPEMAAFKRKFRGRLVTYTEATHFRSGLERVLIRLYQAFRR